MFVFVLDSVPVSRFHIQDRGVYTYIRERYAVAEKDQDSLASQIYFVQSFIARDCSFFSCAYNDFLEFPKLLALFRQSKKAQAECIEPWRHDFEGTRDSLIAKMEKDPKLGPWVYRYDHLSKDKDVRYQLFYSDKNHDFPVNEEACYNTDNWLSILTIAAVLQEYDEQYAASAETSDKEETLLLRLSLYFKDENITKRFLESVRKMKTDDEVITLVKKYSHPSLYYGKSKKLWYLLYNEKLYTKTYNNWCDQLKKR